MMSFNDFYAKFSGASKFFEQATKRLIVAGLSGALVFSLAACGLAGSAESTQTSTEVISEQASADESTVVAETANTETAGFFSDRDLDSTYDEKDATKITLLDNGTTVEGEGVLVDGSTVTITAAGTYVVSGELADGRIVVDVDDSSKVQLVLDGANVTSSSGTALYVRNADKVFVTLADGSTNVLTATGETTEEDDHSLDATLYSCDDLTINGAGSLSVTSAAGHGISGKDEVTLVSGTISVEAVKSAIQGKDSVAIKDGTYVLKAGTDGIHAEHEDDQEKGLVYVAGGTLNIEAQADGIDASGDVSIYGGTLTITSGDDGIHSECDLYIAGGTIRIPQSYEALEGATVTVAGGDLDVVAADDGLNATGVSDDTSSDDTPQEGQMPQGGQMPDGGEMPSMPQDGQVPEGNQVPEDSQMSEPPGFGDGSGDGFANMQMGGSPFENDETASITISGGKFVVTSGGDGIDSNGSLTITGGETYVNGPTSDGDGILDFGGEGIITGGTIVALGSSGMAQGFDASSSQASMLVSASGSAGDAIQLTDASGNVLASYTALKDYRCIILSAPGMTEGETYTLTYGSTSQEVTL